MRGGYKRIRTFAHASQAFSHNVHAVSSIPMCPLAMTLILSSFPLLVCGLHLPSRLLSSWQFLIQMPPEREEEGQVKRHAWKVLETRLGWWGCPMQHTPHIGFPFPVTIGATLAVVWALPDALVPPLHLPTCLALQGEGKKRGV